MKFLGLILVTVILVPISCDRSPVEVPVVPEVAVRTPTSTDRLLRYDGLLDPATASTTERELEVSDLVGPVEIPFATLESKHHAGFVDIDLESRLATLRIEGVGRLEPEKCGIPVDLREISAGRFAIAFREIPLNRLWLIIWDPADDSTDWISVGRDDVDYLMFRGAIGRDRDLHWVVYDNRSRKNYLLDFTEGADGWERIGPEIELPTLEVPAGLNYEMEPPVFLFEVDDHLELVAGNLHLVFEGREMRVSRIPDCEKVLEAVRTDRGLAMLCIRRNPDADGVFKLVLPDAKPRVLSWDEGVPFGLFWDGSTDSVEYELAVGPASYGRLLAHDLRRGQNGGLLELGSDNIEGRVAWAQIYYLNGLMDAIYLARRDAGASEVFLPMIGDLRLRLEIEMRLLDRLLSEDSGMYTKAFTVDRSLALFAVQTSRFLLLFDRYRRMFPGAAALRSHDDVRSRVTSLDGHIEVLATSGEENHWLEKGRHHLRWPLGCAFPFDGLGVPYNHQNEWAYSIFESRRASGGPGDDDDLTPQRDVINHFVDHLAPTGCFPELEDWNYWWGRAFDGYDEVSATSINMPAYAGDKSLAWISFRTIDLMSVLSSLDFMPEINADSVIESAEACVRRGVVFPFAARELIEAGIEPRLRLSIATQYARSGAPWELANQVWSLAMLPKTGYEEGEALPTGLPPGSEPEP